MNAITPTIPGNAEALINAVSDRLQGVVETLMLLRDQTDNAHAYVLMVLEGAIGDQIDTLDQHLKPLVTGRMPVPVQTDRRVPRAG